MNGIIASDFEDGDAIEPEGFVPQDESALDADIGGDRDQITFSIRRGKVVPQLKAQPVNETPKGVGFVDQISFTFLDDLHTNKVLREQLRKMGVMLRGLQCDRETVQNGVAAILQDVFGLAVGSERATGLNFYKRTWALSHGAGMVSIGGQQNTVLVQITGQGLAMARPGWQERLSNWAALMHRFVITRIDLAYDDAEGKSYSVDQAATDYDNGHFTWRGRPPSCEQKGNWRRLDWKGRSFYVGKRENGKMLRVYEKGRQLGDKDSEWVRIELELHNKDREIPFDAVFRPGAYLAGAYKAITWVSGGVPYSRISTVQKVIKMTYETLLEHLGHAYGGLLGVILECEESALDRLAALARGRPMPARLVPALSALDRVVEAGQ